ncbi:MAG: hypothetical protein AAGF31_01195 [Planctomycetota bacterium]
MACLIAGWAASPAAAEDVYELVTGKPAGEQVEEPVDVFEALAAAIDESEAENTQAPVNELARRAASAARREKVIKPRSTPANPFLNKPSEAAAADAQCSEGPLFDWLPAAAADDSDVASQYLGRDFAKASLQASPAVRKSQELAELNYALKQPATAGGLFDRYGDVIQTAASEPRLAFRAPTIGDAYADDEPEGFELEASVSGNARRSASRRNERPLPELNPIESVSVDLTPKPETIDGEQTSTELPPNLARQQFGSYAEATQGGNEWVRFAVQDYLWNSPASRHKPLYFEQINLERYGSHMCGNCWASFAATGHFFGSALSLPYQLAAQPPRECIYTLGHYRPGNCNPHFVHLSRPRLKGFAAQGAAVAGFVLLFP